MQKMWLGRENGIIQKSSGRGKGILLSSALVCAVLAPGQLFHDYLQPANVDSLVPTRWCRLATLIDSN